MFVDRGGFVDYPALAFKTTGSGWCRPAGRTCRCARS
jgi:hypothetical protein